MSVVKNVHFMAPSLFLDISKQWKVSETPKNKTNFLLILNTNTFVTESMDKEAVKVIGSLLQRCGLKLKGNAKRPFSDLVARWP